MLFLIPLFMLFFSISQTMERPKPVVLKPKTVPTRPMPKESSAIEVTPEMHNLLTKYPQFFSDLPENIKIKLARFIEQKLKRLNTDDINKLYPFWASLSPTDGSMRKAQWIALGEMTDLFAVPHGSFIIYKKDLNIPDSKDIPLFKEYVGGISDPFNASQLSSKSKSLAQQFTKSYKIHLMFPEQIATKVVVTILNAFDQDKDLKALIPTFKIQPASYKDGKGNVVPQAVFYIIDGKEAAQKVLNTLYFLFKKENISGSGTRPRFNAKVNDLIWVAQGNGDYKEGASYSQLYEQPLKAYYRSDISGQQENYHLKHPETGQELIN